MEEEGAEEIQAAATAVAKVALWESGSHVPSWTVFSRPAMAES